MTPLPPTAAPTPKDSTLAVAFSVWPLLFGTGVLMLGNGLQGSLLGVRAGQEGFGPGLTGLVMAGFFAGFLIGSIWTPRAVRRVGHIRVFAALAAIASIAILLHDLLVHPAVWALMRVVTGLCYAGVFVIAESWLNDRTDNRNRGQLLSLYMAVGFLGMGGGQALLNVDDPRTATLFILASILISGAVVPILLSATRAPETADPHPVGLGRLYRVSPLGTVGTFAAGLTNGTVFGMGAVYAREAGFSVGEVSAFMGALITGAALLQWPVGRLSDLIDRRRVITAVTFAAAGLAILALMMQGETRLWLLVAVALFGGLGLTIHSLCVAYTNDYLHPAEMVAASSSLVLVLGAGSVIGPIIAGWTLRLVGPDGFFWWLAAVHAGLGLFALYRMTRRDPLPAEQQGPFVPTPARLSPVAQAVAEEAYGEIEAPADDRQA